MDEYSSSHTRGAQILGAWLTTLLWWCIIFSTSLYNCQLVYIMFLQFYTILYCNSYCKMQYKCIYTCIAFYLTLQYSIDGQMMVTNDCNM